MKWIKGVFVGFFAFFIICMGFSTFNNKKEKSMIEGRVLKQFPAFSGEKLIQTEYLNTLSDAFSDQITGRDKMIRAYNRLIVNVLQQKWAGSISIGKNKQLYQGPELITDMEAYEKEVTECAELINKEAAKIKAAGSIFIYLNIPRKDVVETKTLPDYYPDSKKDYDHLIRLLRSKLSDDVLFLDAKDIFEGKEHVYYSTDHHVNFTGQMLIYHKLMSIVKEKFPDVEVKELSDFRQKKRIIDGSFNRRIGYAISSEMEALTVKPLFPYHVKIKHGKKSSIFGGGKTYATAFMGGDHANTFVRSNKKGAPSIFISGSSYTNSLEALCTCSFSTMHSVDYRSNKSGKTLVEYVQSEKPDYVIYLPNQADKHFSLTAFQIHLGLK